MTAIDLLAMGTAWEVEPGTFRVKPVRVVSSDGTLVGDDEMRPHHPAGLYATERLARAAALADARNMADWCRGRLATCEAAMAAAAADVPTELEVAPESLT